MIDEEVDAVLVEEIERVGPAKHGKLRETHGRRHAVHSRRVEVAELVHAETVEPVAAEVLAVQVDRVERGEDEIFRRADIILRERGWRRLERRLESPGI